MKKYDKVISLVSAVCILLSGISITAFGDTQSLSEQTIEVKFRQVIDVAQFTLEEIDDELMQNIIQAGKVQAGFIIRQNKNLKDL